MTAQQALEKLKSGNASYARSGELFVDVSPSTRKHLADCGQQPFAVVISCSDSRVIPEVIFQCGLGQIFTIRLAGNVVDNFAIGSVQYAVEHLKCPLVLVLGHEGCGAVHAAVCGGATGNTKLVTDEILHSVGDEKDELRATERNVWGEVKKLQIAFPKTKVVGAVYKMHGGTVQFFE